MPYKDPIYNKDDITKLDLEIASMLMVELTKIYWPDFFYDYQKFCKKYFNNCQVINNLSAPLNYINLQEYTLDDYCIDYPIQIGEKILNFKFQIIRRREDQLDLIIKEFTVEDIIKLKNISKL